jgi:hypothetical protein
MPTKGAITTSTMDIWAFHVTFKNNYTIMNILKKIVGLLSILIGIGAGYYLIVNQALPLFEKGGNDLVPAIIYTFILAPIITFGMVTFGKYAIQGEFDLK